MLKKIFLRCKIVKLNKKLKVIITHCVIIQIKTKVRYFNNIQLDASIL